MNPIEYIEKCTIHDLVDFRKQTKYVDKNGKIRHSISKQDIVYIAKVYVGVSIERIANKFERPISTIKSQVSKIKNKSQAELDRVDDEMREIAYWKYKQLNKLNEGKV